MGEALGLLTYALFRNEFQLAPKMLPLAFWNGQNFAVGLGFLMLLTVVSLYYNNK